MRIRVFVALAGLAGSAVLFAQLRAGADPLDDVRGIPLPGVQGGGVAGGCTPSTGPDVIVGHVSGIQKWGTVGSITAYSIGAESCNIGSQPLLWDQDSENHPVIGQNLYRLKDGRFEHIGLSWLKHGFAALTLNLCCTCISPGTSQLLGVGCSDPYGSSLNGDQNGFPCGANICGGLGPRSEVNASKGVYIYPYGSAGASGNAIYKRLQVHNDDLDPAQNAGATYWAEVHYVSPDDAQAGNHNNNASRREVVVGGLSGGGWNLSLFGTTTREQPAIYAWQVADPSVTIKLLDDGGGGRFLLGYNVTDNGNGTWHYEYALHNLNSDRSAREFIVPIHPDVTISNMNFHDVDYHSGEPYALTDWAKTVGASECSWSTDTWDTDPDANALRWSSVYNYRFDANAAPQSVTATVGMFKPALIMDLSVLTEGPGEPLNPCRDCDGSDDNVVDTLDFFAVIAQWGMFGTSCDYGLGEPGVGAEEFFEVIAAWGVCP
jgi:hypothetical protein